MKALRVKQAAFGLAALALIAGVAFADTVTITTAPDNLSASGTTNVTVSAVVAPILSMDISTGALDFGTLTPGTTSTQSLALVTATNAKTGLSIDVDSTGLASATHSIGGLVRGGTIATTGTDTYQISSTTLGAGTPHALANVAANQNILTAANVAQANTTTTVNVAATIDAQTEAGNYGDTLTFTVTANF